MCHVLTQITNTNDQDPSKIANANNNLQATQLVFDAWKEVFNEIKENCFEKCGDKSNNMVDEEFVNLVKE